MAALQKLFRVSCRLACSSRSSLIKVYGNHVNLRTTFIGANLINKNHELPIQSLQKRFYAGPPPMDRQNLNERVLLVLRLYDKINPEQVTLESKFKEDLKLDSLDHVEIVMAMEDEFGFEIPDQDAEHLTTPGHIVQYVMDKFDVLDEPAHH